jgi:hypothetical protein
MSAATIPLIVWGAWAAVNGAYVAAIVAAALAAYLNAVSVDGEEEVVERAGATNHDHPAPPPHPRLHTTTTVPPEHHAPISNHLHHPDAITIPSLLGPATDSRIPTHPAPRHAFPLPPHHAGFRLLLAALARFRPMPAPRARAGATEAYGLRPTPNARAREAMPVDIGHCGADKPVGRHRYRRTRAEGCWCSRSCSSRSAQSVWGSGSSGVWVGRACAGGRSRRRGGRDA